MTRCNSCGEDLRCRSCGAEYKGRRQDGMGTYVKPGTPLSVDEGTIYEVAKKALIVRPYGVTRRQVSAELFAQVPRPTRESSKEFDSHYCQAELSRLVGRGMLNARKMERGNALLYFLPPVPSKPLDTYHSQSP